jgi:hypothetical protein
MGRREAPPDKGCAKQSIFFLCASRLDCSVARVPLRKRFAFVADDDDVEVLVICPTG